MDQYDERIQQAAGAYLPTRDWRMYKAQIIAESALNPLAVSPVGAKGLAQFMPGTWAEVSQELALPPTAEATDPFFAIPAGAYYMGSLVSKWTSPRPDIDRYCLALASYNAGFGNLLKAQLVAGGANDYAAIIAGLSQVTGDHAAETTDYVPRILHIFNRLVTEA